MKGKILFLFVFVWSFSFVYAQYPASYGADNTEDWIQQVSIESINNYTYDEEGGYSDFSSSYIATLNTGTAYNITVDVVASGSPFITAWVDWNQNFDFTDAELKRVKFLNSKGGDGNIMNFDFKSSNIDISEFKNLFMMNTDFSNVTCRNTTFEDIEFMNTDFFNAKFIKCVFKNIIFIFESQFIKFD